MEPVSTGKFVSKSMLEVSRTLLAHFVEATDTTDFCAHINNGRLNVKQFLKWSMFLKTVRAKKIVDEMRAKAIALLKNLKLTMHARFRNSNQWEMGTGKVPRVLRPSFAAATYVEKDLRVCKSFYTLFRAGQSSVTLINRARFPQPVPNSTWWGSLARSNVTTLSALEVLLFFHSIATVEKAIQRKALKCLRSYSTKTLHGYIIQKNSKAWTAFAEAANLAPLV